MGGVRGQFNTRFGFIMAAVGSAVGLGNLVRFPGELNENGGAAFLIVYLGLLLLVGLPALLGEMSLGKIANASPVNAFRQLGGKHGKKWAIIGVFGMMAAIFVMFFYTVLAGWALRFFVETFRDGWWGAGGGAALYAVTETGPWTMLWHGLVTVATVYIVARGVSGGIEKATVIIMPTLFAIIIGIVIFALFQPGMGAGYAAIFKPDFTELSANNVSKAIGQVFFSLSLGQGAMLTYASYMDKKQSVTKDGTTIGFADTGVAILAGMMVFPVLAVAGLLNDPNVTGPTASSFGVAFQALPEAFFQMGPVAGRLVGGAFFLGLFFAAVTSAISLIEVPVSVMIDNLSTVRWKAATIIGGLTYSFGVMAAINGHWLEMYDEIAVNIFIIIGVAITTFFAGWFAKGVAKELDAGLKSRIGIYFVWMMRTVTPLLVVAVFIVGGFFGGESGLEFWSNTEGKEAGFRKLGHTIRAALTFEH